MAGPTVNQLILDEVRSLKADMRAIVDNHELRLSAVEDREKERDGAIKGIKWFVGVCVLVCGLLGISIVMPWGKEIQIGRSL